MINLWLNDADAESAKLLEGSDLDLAVASGAAYYGHVRQGKGVRIRGGIASSYYVGIESAMPAIPGMAPPMEALCVAPFGMEEGSSVEVTDKEFGLLSASQFTSNSTAQPLAVMTSRVPPRLLA